ncbi:TPA: radical SAM protein [bacterium]|nr:radical SAM protein [bacterium]
MIKEKKDLKYIYGPVASWRLEASLGIDPLSQEEKICTFDCIYCQLGKTLVYPYRRRIYVPTEAIIGELKALPEIRINYITFSGRGEPTLAKNLGQMIRAVKAIRPESVAVLTNSSLMSQPEVREDLVEADLVVAKLDAYSSASFEKINRPQPGIEFNIVVEGIRQFRVISSHRLALQIMFVEENKNHPEEFWPILDYIQPDEIQINTPLRPSPVQPLSQEEISKIKRCFSTYNEFLPEGRKINLISIYDVKPRAVSSISDENTLKRRGKV